ncbi:MAG: endonuclease/exonuclease/phosphatase family protein [Bacteroidota bacterium]
MKKLGFFGKMFYFVNIVFGLLLIASYFVPLIYPGTIPFIATLSLLMPVLMIINIVFVLLWIMNLNIRFIFSLVILILGINHIDNFFRWSNSQFVGSEDLKVMTFNVRMFNVFNWIKEPGIENEIYDLVKNESPDIVAFQEYHQMKNFDIGDYEYTHFYYPGTEKYWGQAIFSKYKIISNGNVKFPSTSNSAVYIDIDVNGDYVRVYSIHLETLSLDKSDLALDKAFDISDSKNNIGNNVRSIASKIDKGFGRHGEQADLLREHINSSPYPVIVMGDFNSSAFSYEYREIRGDLVDAFEVGGQGFGKTFDFKYFPLRIDFVFGDPNFRVVGFKTLNNKALSDHYPVMASYNIR